MILAGANGCRTAQLAPDRQVESWSEQHLRTSATAGPSMRWRRSTTATARRIPTSSSLAPVRSPGSGAVIGCSRSGAVAVS